MRTTGTKENHTHIKFYYKGGNKMTVNKFTLDRVWPGEEDNSEVERIEYLIETDD